MLAQSTIELEENKTNIFLSYGKNNKKRSLELNEILKNEGLKIWIDTEKMANGNISDLMRNGIKNSDLFLCCLTDNYLKSENCMRELRLAASFGKLILFVLFENTSMSSKEIFKQYEKVANYVVDEIYYKITDLNKLKCGIFSALKQLVKILLNSILRALLLNLK